MNRVLGTIATGWVYQQKTILGFIGMAKQKSVCARLFNFLKTFDSDFSDDAQAIWEMAQLHDLLFHGNAIDASCIVQ
ncbi:MAG: hypothetical protein H0X26_07960 [Alphaproteobacteria bacterium]|nr:hypothetical protein [Alphaproteobacteria bacterium]